MAGTVYVGLELAALGGNLAYPGETEHLESAAVGKDGAVPVLEFMQASGGAKGLEARAQVEVVCVAKYDLGAYVFL